MKTGTIVTEMTEALNLAVKLNWNSACDYVHKEQEYSRVMVPKAI